MALKCIPTFKFLFHWEGEGGESPYNRCNHVTEYVRREIAAESSEWSQDFSSVATVASVSYLFWQMRVRTVFWKSDVSAVDGEIG